MSGSRRWLGLVAPTIGGMAALDPLAGGWFVTHLSWRWAFCVNLPIAALSHRSSLPRDLSGEITAEPIHARIRVARSETRITALESLLELVWLLEQELRRPVTVLDLLSGAVPAERERRLRLVRALRPRGSA